jgi:splicing factor U2AF 65 kDa subunit
MNAHFTHPKANIFPIPLVFPVERKTSPSQQNHGESIDIRELFVGSIPSGTTDNDLLEFLNLAMMIGGLTADDLTGSIKVAHVSGHLLNKYAFLEFRTAQDASNALNLSHIPFNGSNLQFRRPTKYHGPNMPHITWQQLILAQAQQIQLKILSSNPSYRPPPQLLINQALNVAEFKVNSQAITYRELYIGGFTSEIQETTLISFIWSALQRLCLTTSPSNPILQCRLQPTFAFLEFRTSQEAANCLNLNGIPFMGQILKVSRPTPYPGPNISFYSWGELSTLWVSGELKLLLSGIPSPVIQLSNMMSPEDQENPTTIQEVIWDLNNECEQYGNILSVKHDISKGNFFVLMETIEAAKKALVSLKGRSYDQRVVNAKFYPVDQFIRSNFTEIPSLILSAAGLCTLNEVVGVASTQMPLPGTSSSLASTMPINRNQWPSPLLISQSGIPSFPSPSFLLPSSDHLSTISIRSPSLLSLDSSSLLN